MRRLILLFTVVSLTIAINSCSESSTGADSEPEPGPEPEPEQTTGTLEVITTTSGSDKDSDGYTIAVDGSNSKSASVEDTLSYGDLEEGSHDVEVTRLASNCSVDGSNPRNVDITADETTSTTYNMSCTSTSDGSDSGSNNKIVFQSDRDGDDEIFVMSADGSNQQKLTDNSVDDREPVISHDGKKIAFVSYRGSSANIYLMDIDGSNVQQVTQSFDIPFSPQLSWAPDDSKIAFHDKRSGDGETYSEEAFHNEIYTINTDGSNLTRLTNNDSFDGHASWSADGNKIVFNSSRDGGVNSDQEIYTVNADGSNPQRITNDSVENYSARWSPDGSKFVYVRNQDQNDDIYIMNTDGSGVQQVTDFGGEDLGPVWSADGSEILFVTTRDYNREVYKINADGSGSPTNLTQNNALDAAPFWSLVK